MTEITCKNDLYAHLGEELRNDAKGQSYGTLDRVRAAYDRVEFISGEKRVDYTVEQVITMIETSSADFKQTE